MGEDRLTPASDIARRYGSDVMVDAMRACDLPYVALNPGSSFRGLHDSLVNYGGNRPALIECQHEKVAVGIAHGFAKASGHPMGVILHNVVGLLHGAMGLYYAHVDRAPVMAFGGAGPMALGRRRPNIDWIHSANVQGNAIRDYVKWDDQPFSIGSIFDTIARAHRVAVSHPQGPVYVALDAGLQEDELVGGEELPDMSRLAPASPIGPEASALRGLVERLMAASRPVIIAGYAGRDPANFHHLVELAELVGAGVVDTGVRLNFPNRHPYNVTGSSALEEADCVLFVDVKDTGKSTQQLDSTSRKVQSRLPKGTTVLDIGFGELEIASWSHDFGARIETDVQVTADASVALPEVIAAAREVRARGDGDDRHGWRQRCTELHEQTWKAWQATVADAQEQRPVAPARLAAEVWEAIRTHDWALTAGTAHGWAPRVWDFDQPYRHPGGSLGTATQIGISLGVALAHRDGRVDGRGPADGRLVVDLQPDGDLMFDLGALWTAAYHRLPILVVMFNNRAYYNDWEHQERMAKLRGTPLDNAFYGMEIADPAPDFGAVARAMGWHGEGPIDDPAKVQPAVVRAADLVLSTGRPALVDVVCQYR